MVIDEADSCLAAKGLRKVSQQVGMSRFNFLAHFLLELDSVCFFCSLVGRCSVLETTVYCMISSPLRDSDNDDDFDGEDDGNGHDTVNFESVYLNQKNCRF